MTGTNLPELVYVSLGASTLGGALGMASGVVIAPLLTIIAGMDIHHAVGASLVSVIACSCGSAAPFLRWRLANFRLAIVLEPAATPGAVSGVPVSGLILTRLLCAAFAAVPVAILLSTLLGVDAG